MPVDNRKTYRGMDRNELRATLNRLRRLIAWNLKKTNFPSRGGPVFVQTGVLMANINGPITAALESALAHTGPTFTPID